MANLLTQAATDKGKQNLIKAMAFCGGTLSSFDREAQKAANSQGLAYDLKHDYRSEVEKMVNDTNNQFQILKSNYGNQQSYTSNVQDNRQEIMNYNQMPVQPQPVYYNQPTQQSKKMPDISDYIKPRNKKVQQPQNNDNPLLSALNEANAPIIKMLDIICGILGMIHEEQVKTNELLESNRNIDMGFEDDFQNIPEKTFEEELAELDKKSQELLPEDLTNPSVIDEEPNF